MQPAWAAHNSDLILFQSSQLENSIGTLMVSPCLKWKSINGLINHRNSENYFTFDTVSDFYPTTELGFPTYH